MRAVIGHSFGGPEVYGIEECSRLDPGHGKVRLKIEAAGVSFVDVLLAAGKYQVKPPLPYTPGTEFAGVIDAVGEGVDPARVGERVCASGFGGGFAEAAISPAENVHKIPDAMSFEEASVFQVNYATARYALVERARVQPGEKVLVLGAAGGIGIAAIQIAVASGATVIGSASTDAKRALAQSAGAAHVVDSRAEDLREQVKAIVGKNGVDIVVDPVGGASTERAFRALGWGGRHLVIGFTEGAIPKLPTNLPLLKGADLLGVDIRQYREREPKAAARNQQAVFELYAKGGLKPALGPCFAFEDFRSAMEAATNRATAGRVVLRMEPSHDSQVEDKKY